MHLTVLIPHREAAEEVERLAVVLARLLERRERPYEIVCVDDGSSIDHVRHLQRLRREISSLRLLRLDRPSGLSAALSAGIAAARGEVIVAFEASRQYVPEQIPWLIERLARADLVIGRRHRSRTAKLWHATLQLPRRWLLGLEVRDPDCLFWAARREAVAGLDMSPGMHRFLASLVTTRGFRVAEMHVDHQPAGSSAWNEPRCALGNLLAVWWHRRNFRSFTVEELGAANSHRAAA